MKNEYATDYLYFKEPTIPSTTQGEKAKLVFGTRKELNDEIVRRARAVMGMRGLKKADKVSVNVTQLRDRIPLEITNDQLADMACRVADDTMGYELQYL